MRKDIEAAVKQGRLLNRQCFQTPKGEYSLSIVSHGGDYFFIKRLDGVIVEAKNIRKDLDKADGE